MKSFNVFFSTRYHIIIHLSFQSKNTFQDFSIFMPIFDNFVCFFGTGAIESMLEPHLRSIEASNYQVGLTFAIYGGVYVISSPIAGYVRLFYNTFTFRDVISKICQVSPRLFQTQLLVGTKLKVLVKLYYQTHESWTWL